MSFGRGRGLARGFALPSVLVTIVGLAAMAAAIAPLGVAKVAEHDAQRRRLEQRLLLEAGLARGLLALLAPGDPMTEVLRRDGQAAWEFEGQPILISFSIESHKLDLNEADLGTIRAGIAGALGPPIATAAQSRLARMRAEGRRISSPDEILPFEHRFGPIAARLRDLTTAYDGLTALPTRQESGNDGAMVHTHERPIFTLRASQPGHPRALAQTVVIDPQSKRYAVIDRLELSLVATRPQ